MKLISLHSGWRHGYRRKGAAAWLAEKQNVEIDIANLGPGRDT